MLNKFFTKKTPETTQPDFDANTAFQAAMQYHQTGNLAQAESLYREILQHEPLHVDCLHFLGVLLYQAGQLQSAADLIQQAIRIMPDASAMHCNLGLVLQALGQLDAAAESYQSALSLQPDYIEALNNLGMVLQQQKKLEQAYEVLQKAVSLNPHYAVSYNNLGNVLKDQNNLKAASDCFQQAIALNPNYLEACSNLGFVSQGLRDLKLAQESYQKALLINPNDINSHCALGLLFLLQGEYRQGWQYCEARYHLGGLPIFPFPQWQGESLVGKSLLIWFEQGLGDEIQFCRYIPLLKSQGARHITWVCRKPLQTLFKTLEGIDRVATPEEVDTINPHDYWTLPFSLPLHCQTTLETIPSSVPYLSANSERVEKYATQLQNVNVLKIGICWRGNPNYPGDAIRSPGLGWFSELFKLPGVKFFTLQPGTRKEFLDAAQSAGIDINRELDESSFEDAAALIMNLDLVIACDTAICHLAAALGKPVWLVLPFANDWRWLSEREDNPWYPTIRLFRQKERGNWADVFQRAEQKLKAVLAGKDSLVWPV